MHTNPTYLSVRAANNGTSLKSNGLIQVNVVRIQIPYLKYFLLYTRFLKQSKVFINSKIYVHNYLDINFCLYGLSIFRFECYNKQLKFNRNIYINIVL